MNGLAGILAVAAIIGTSAGVACAQPTAGTVDLAGAAPNTDVAKQPGTLSDKLSTTNGVIHPEGDMDPGIDKPAPAAGTMMVIPPSRTPGELGDVQPK